MHEGWTKARHRWIGCGGAFIPGVVLLIVLAGRATAFASRDPARAFAVDRCAVASLSIDAVAPGRLRVDIELPYLGVRQLVLQKHTLRSDDFRVWVDDGSGQLEEVDSPPSESYVGSVVEEPAFVVRASCDGVSLRALIVDGSGSGQGWAIQPLIDAPGLAAAPGGDHVIYHTSDNAPLSGSCGVGPNVGSATGAVPFGTGLMIGDLALDADYPFYVASGSSVAATVLEMESVINGLAAIYAQPSVSIVHQISTIVVRTTGTYTTTNPSLLLGQFRSRWNSVPEATIARDVAHLFTGRELDTDVIGIAEFASLCDLDLAYSLSQSRYTTNWTRRVALTAHEIGHNWGAAHCDGLPACRIMCSAIGACDGLTPLTFAPTSASQIAIYRAGAICLLELPPPHALPFEEDFPMPTMDPMRWTYVSGVSVTASAAGIPSPPYALTLNASGGGPYADDELRSGPIAMASAADPTVQFRWSRGGVAAGGAMVVEYLNAAFDWIVVDEFVSDGTDPSGFALRTFDLDDDAKHDDFRLRFRAAVAGSSENWYVDDVYVGDGAPFTGGPPRIDAIDPPDGPLAGGQLLTIHGSDFASDAAVLLGGESLVDIELVDSTELRGLTPAAVTAGLVDVILAQSSGAAAIADGYRYTNQRVRIDTVTGAPGELLELPVRADHDTALAAFVLGVDYDGTFVDVVDVTTDLADGPVPDFIDIAIDDEDEPAGSWFTAEVIYDVIAPIDMSLPPGDGQVLLTAFVMVEAFAPSGARARFAARSGVGEPPVDLQFTWVGGVTIEPASRSGAVEIDAARFVRGDANRDGVVDVADAVTMLSMLFGGVPLECADAVDANDDGANDIADAIYVLSFLFADGAAPSSPYPDVGVDPTPDALICI